MIRERIRFDLEAPVAFVRIAPGHDRVVGVSAVDSRSILRGWGGGEVARWDLPPRRGVVTGAAFHPDGTVFAVTGPARPMDIDRTEDGTLVDTFEVLPASIRLEDELARRDPGAGPSWTGSLGAMFSPSGGLIPAGRTGPPSPR